MSLFEMVAVLLVLSAALSYLNHRLLRLPTTIGLMALTLLASLVLVVLGRFFPAIDQRAAAFVHQIDFNQAVLPGMLGFLLFAGTLHIDLGDLRQQKLPILVLATVGVLLSTAIVGLLSWCLLGVLGVEMRLVYCLLFGALISPTDPIAVLALLRRLGAPKPLETTIAGESLFNDGVGVAVFMGLLEVATAGADLGPVHLGGLFLREAVGGAGFGLAVGLLFYGLFRSVDDYHVEVLLSLALVAGGYALANALHLSGPIAMVVAGLLIGNHGRQFAMSPTTVEHLDRFWELIDEVLNAVLFVLLGLEVLAVRFTERYLLLGLLAIPLVLGAHLVSVWLPLEVLRRHWPRGRRTLAILTWGGLRGAISVALALSLPREVGEQPVPERDVILVMTYVVVVFSVLVQGLTMGPLTRRWLAQQRAEPAA